MNTEKWETLPEAIRNATTTLLGSAGVTLEMLFPEDPAARMQPMLTKAEAAQIANVSIDTISRAIKDGQLMARKIHPGRTGAVRIFQEDFYAWLNGPAR